METGARETDHLLPRNEPGSQAGSQAGTGRALGVARLVLAGAVGCALWAVGHSVMGLNASVPCSGPLALSSDCARLGIIWPAANMALAAAATMVLAVPRALGPVVTHWAQGPTTHGGALLSFHDNRLRVAAAACAVAVAVAGGALVLVLLSTGGRWGVGLHQRVYWQSYCVFWAAAAAAAVCDLAAFVRARCAAAACPPFRWPLLVLLAAQAAVCAVELLHMLFAGRHVHEPVGASVHACAAMAAAALAVAALVLPLCAHRRGFYLPREDPDPTRAAGNSDDLVVGPDVIPLEYHTSLTKEKREDIPPVTSPEDAHSMLGQLVFSWVTPVLRIGTKTTIGSADLYHLGAKNRPLSIWRRYASCRTPGMSLLWALVWTFAPQLTTQAALAVLNATLEYSQPFFLQRILRSIRLYGHPAPGLAGSVSKRMICLDAAGLLVSSVLHSMSLNRVLWIGRIISLRLQGLLVAELSSKALQRRSKCVSDPEKLATTKAADSDTKSKSNGKGGDDDEDDDEKDRTANSDGRVANMLTSDLESLGHIASYLDGIYRTPIAFCIGTWYLYNMLGVSALIGLALTAMYYPLTRLMMKYLIKMQRKLCALDDERVTMVTEAFQGIRAVKLFGWQSRFIEKVRAKRNEEISAWWRLTFLQLPVVFVRSITTSLILVAVLAIYSLWFGHALTADVVFPAMTVFAMVSSTFNSIPGMFQWLAGSYVSLKRIDTFMVQSRLQPLTDRVAQDAAAEPGTVGFEGASFEWTAAAMPSDEEPRGHAPPCRLSDDEDDGDDGPETAGMTRADSPTSHRSSLSGQTPLVSGRGSTSYGSITPADEALTTPTTTAASTSEVRTASKDMRQFALCDITLRFPAGALSLVAGPTGSGKSSLLTALIGEMTLTKGRVVLPTADPRDLDARLAGSEYREIIELSGQRTVMTDVAYVAQEAWLRNATIRDNILFGERYDAARYEEVLHMCALKPDLRILAGGDQTEIGERGITLSGGQKQRVALARAVYSSRRILLIDDCLSAVDAHTGKHILHSCLASSSPLMQGRTRVLVTHHVAMCLPHAQFIAVMNDGRVALSGSPQELRGAGHELSEVLSLGHGIDATQRNEADTAADDAQAGVGSGKSEDAYNAERRAARAQQLADDPTATVNEGLLVDDEEREQGYVRPEVWLQYMRMCGGWRFWSVVVGLVMVTRMGGIAQSYWIRIWMSETTGPEGSAHGIVFWLGIYTLIEMMCTGLYMVAWLVELGGSIRAARQYHEDLFARVINAVPRFFDKTPIGRVISRFSRDMRTIDDSIIGLIAALGMQLFQVASVFMIISSVMPAFVPIAVLMTIAYAMLAIYYLNATRELKRLDSISMSPLLSLFSELITGVESIRAFGAQNQYTMEAMNRVNVHNRPYYLMWGANRWLCTRIEFSGCIVSFSATVLIIMSLDSIDAGLAGFVLMYAMSFSNYMLWFIRNYSECEISMNSVERVNQYLILEQEAPAQAEPHCRPPAEWPHTGNVEVQDLTIEYVPGAPVLHGISFAAAHGEKIGVVGRTGAGKSTLSLAFLRFIEAAQGRIYIDGVDIARIGLEDLRRNVTIIPQDPVLFNGTIRFNLDPFSEYPDQLLWDALQRTCLMQDADAQSGATSVEPAGKHTPQPDATPALGRMSGVFGSLDAEIKENGKNLSLGQRQLIALARALVRRSRVVIMDEATASVDFDTDARIQRTIRGAEFADSTLFCIAHRLRTVIDYDRVLVLEQGRIVEFDTPWNLLQAADGHFRSMCEKTGELAHLLAVAQAARPQPLAPATSE